MPERIGERFSEAGTDAGDRSPPSGWGARWAGEVPVRESPPWGPEVNYNSSPRLIAHTPLVWNSHAAASWAAIISISYLGFPPGGCGPAFRGSAVQP